MKALQGVVVGLRQIPHPPAFNGPLAEHNIGRNKVTITSDVKRVHTGWLHGYGSRIGGGNGENSGALTSKCHSRTSGLVRCRPCKYLISKLPKLNFAKLFGHFFKISKYSIQLRKASLLFRSRLTGNDLLRTTDTDHNSSKWSDDLVQEPCGAWPIRTSSAASGSYITVLPLPKL